MTLEIYKPGQSVLHVLDPRLKVGGLAWLSVLITLAEWHGLLALSLVLLVLTIASQVSLKVYRSMSIALVGIAIFYSIASGWVWTETWYFWQGHWSIEGLKVAGMMIWRIALVFTLTRLFMAVTQTLEQGIGIAYFVTTLTRFTPRAADFAFLLTLTLRFIPLLAEEAALLWKARIAKGNLPASRSKRVRDIAALLVPLILLSLRRAEEVAENLIARGYVSGRYQVLSTKEWDYRDRWGTVILGIVGIIVIGLKVRYLRI